MNLFDLPRPLPTEELFEVLVPDHGIRIERIVSVGHASPPGEYYDQDRDEWVALLQGQAHLVWADGRSMHLNPGDWVFLPAHERHRVEWTSADPPCVWLAVHGNIR